MPELIHPNWGTSTNSALIRMGSKLKTDTVLNDETSEIERDMCVFGPTGGGGVPQLLHRYSLVNDVPIFDWWMHMDASSRRMGTF